MLNTSVLITIPFLSLLPIYALRAQLSYQLQPPGHHPVQRRHRDLHLRPGIRPLRSVHFRGSVHRELTLGYAGESSKYPLDQTVNSNRRSARSSRSTSFCQNSKLSKSPAGQASQGIPCCHFSPQEAVKVRSKFPDNAVPSQSSVPQINYILSFKIFFSPFSSHKKLSSHFKLKEIFPEREKSKQVKV